MVGVSTSLFRQVLSFVWSGILILVLTLFVQGIWTGLVVANLKTSSRFPWAVVVMALLLWLTWQYLNGKGWPQSTSEARRRNLRATPLSGRVFGCAVLAGVLSIIALTGFWIVLFQLAKVPGNALPNLSQYTRLTVALMLLMASVVGAIVEEAGFRGYFQGLLERSINGPAAIFVAALVMAPGHALTQGFVWPTLVFYLFVDVMLGLIAYLTKSILPGITVHAIGLITFFSLVWPNDARRLKGTGAGDAWLWIHAAQTIIFTALAIIAFKRLMRTKPMMESRATATSVR